MPIDIILLHMSTINEDHLMYVSWDTRQQIYFFVILDHFLFFYSPDNLENKYLEKTKKRASNIIILHMCAIHGSHMMYGFWDMDCNRQIFCNCGSFYLFLPFYPRYNLKNPNFEKNEKNTWIYHHFTQVYQKLRSYPIMCLRCDMWQIFF